MDDVVWIRLGGKFLALPGDMYFAEFCNYLMENSSFILREMRVVFQDRSFVIIDRDANSRRLVETVLRVQRQQ